MSAAPARDAARTGDADRWAVYLVTDADQCAAVARTASLNRRDVRRRFDERFSATAMARRYLDLYANQSVTRPDIALVANG